MPKKKQFNINPDLVINYKNQGIVLVKRKKQPYKDYWALPGGRLIKFKESVEEATVRELKEETNLRVKKEDLKLINIYSNPKRDPRGHLISVAFYSKVLKGKLKAGSDAKEVKVFKKIPKNLAFDHKTIVKQTFKR